MILSAVHRVVAKAFRAAGFRWEERRFGEQRLGLWRRSWKKGRAPAHPKRFVLIPGWGDTPLSWLTTLIVLLPTLRRRYDEIVLFDFPGFQGFLHDHKCFTSMDHLIAAVSDTLDSLKPHTIFGHSLGGWLAAQYAAGFGAPEARSRAYSGPETIIVTSPSGVFGDETSREEWKTKFERVREGEVFAIRKDLFKKEPIWFRLIEKQYTRFILQDGMKQFMGSLREEHLVERVLHQVRAKVWVVWGEHDTLAPAAWIEAWLRLLNERGPDVPPAHGVLIRDAGHSPQIEAPGATALLLKEILDSGKTSRGRLAKRYWKEWGSAALALALWIAPGPGAWAAEAKKVPAESAPVSSEVVDPTLKDPSFPLEPGRKKAEPIRTDGYVQGLREPPSEKEERFRAYRRAPGVWDFEVQVGWLGETRTRSTSATLGSGSTTSFAPVGGSVVFRGSPPEGGIPGMLTILAGAEVFTGQVTATSAGTTTISGTQFTGLDAGLNAGLALELPLPGPPAHSVNVSVQGEYALGSSLALLNSGATAWQSASCTALLLKPGLSYRFWPDGDWWVRAEMTYGLGVGGSILGTGNWSSYSRVRGEISVARFLAERHALALRIRFESETASVSSAGLTVTGTEGALALAWVANW